MIKTVGGGMDQAENFQQDNVADEKVQGESAVEKIQQDDLQQSTIHQEIVDIFDEEENEELISFEDLEQLEKDLLKFHTWMRIRNLHLVESN